MLKRADDKSKRLTLLEELQHSAVLDAGQKKWAGEEWNRLRKGIQGESESAFYLDQYFKDGENHVVLHDLRVVVDGDVAQIDHLAINRAVGMYLIETKNYAGNVTISDYGEFTVDYGRDQYGVPSPIEQSRRHARILQRLLERLGIVGRTGALLECRHIVMFHPKAIIKRPPAGVFDTSNVIKADQFPSWHGQFLDKDFGVVKLVQAAVNMRSLDTIKEWGEKLMRQHRPTNLLELPEFMQPKRAPPTKAVSAVPAPPVAPAVQQAAASQSSEAPAKKLICLHCSAKISFPEGKFCWSNQARFKGGQYCREHQALF